jgi:purine-nucleoside phosphorylase
MGIKYLILTNAAGGVNHNFQVGQLMLITDYINFTGRNPLRGKNLDEFGPRFPDMSQAFSPKLRKLAFQEAEKMDIPLQQGVYCWFNGPTYETPAEIRTARILGADAVGMSTVPETIVARHCGMEVLGISVITNLAAGMSEQALSHEEVLESGKKVKQVFSKLIDAIILQI